MKYIISENRITDLVEQMVREVYPGFNSENAGVATYSNGDDTYLEYYNKDRRKWSNGRPEIYARYYVWKNELVLSQDLFLTLESFFGEERMAFVIDWFNKEFDKDAEYIDF